MDGEGRGDERRAAYDFFRFDISLPYDIIYIYIYYGIIYIYFIKIYNIYILKYLRRNLRVLRTRGLLRTTMIRYPVFRPIAMENSYCSKVDLPPPSRSS